MIGAHRRALAPIDGRLRLGQRFAVDFAARLNRTGRTHRGSSSKNSSYFNYGTPLLAVGDGKVVAAVDRYPSQIPNAQVPVTGDALDGNHVIIKLDDGVYAGYAHMKPGSVRVRPGQRVKAGQVLGRLGNSGQHRAPPAFPVDGPAFPARRQWPAVHHRPAPIQRGHPRSRSVRRGGSSRQPGAVQPLRRGQAPRARVR